MMIMERILISAVLLLGLAQPAAARDEKLIDNFGEWSAFVGTDRGHKVCYLASAPQKSEGKYAKRGDTYVTITHIPEENSIDVVSIRAGYGYKSGSEAVIEIAGATFKLFTDGEYAWAYDAKSDQRLVAAMKAGRDMVVRGTSSRGTETVDIYSLSGISAAHAAASEACGIK